MKIAKRISTQAWINDFQNDATAEGLIANAVRAGIPANDVEVVDVDEATYISVQDSVLSAIKTQLAADNGLTRQQLISIGTAIKNKLGLTTNQMKLFVKFMRQIDEVDIP